MSIFFREFDKIISLFGLTFRLISYFLLYYANNYSLILLLALFLTKITVLLLIFFTNYALYSYVNNVLY